MDEKEEEEFLKMIGLKGTMPILRFMNEKGEAQYTDLMQLINVVSLNTRLKQLLHFRLIQHNMERLELRREWYTVTEKGRKVLNYLNEVLEVMDSE